MKNRFRLIRRGSRSKICYCVDNRTGKRTSLGKISRDEAQQLLEAKNNAERQPLLNLQIAKAYLAGTDSGVTERTWGNALQTIIDLKKGENRKRWTTVSKDKALGPLLGKVVVETKADELLKSLHVGTVSTNIFLRRIHNFCIDMGWLPWPILPKRQWPPIQPKRKRGVTTSEHKAILERETNPERKAFYELAWHLGASQLDLANLRAENIDWHNQLITYFRKKTESRNLPPVQIRFGKEVADILATLPKTGPLFPMLCKVRSGDRATEFKQRCDGLGIKGISLHSYRYSWAQRAKQAGYPERYAQVALGHNSKAVHAAYARDVVVTIPALEDYERKIIPFSPTEPVNEDSKSKQNGSNS